MTVSLRRSVQELSYRENGNTDRLQYMPVRSTDQPTDHAGIVVP